MMWRAVDLKLPAKVQHVAAKAFVPDQGAMVAARRFELPTPSLWIKSSHVSLRMPGLSREHLAFGIGAHFVLARTWRAWNCR